MKKWQIVTIKNHTLSGREIVEGQARLVRCLSKIDKRWLVEFTDAPGQLFERVIY